MKSQNGTEEPSQGSKFSFPTFPYLSLLVFSEVVAVFFIEYNHWSHKWYLCHFHSKKKQESLLLSTVQWKENEISPICKALTCLL